MTAFMGEDGTSLDMLFVHGDELGKGFSSALLKHDIDHNHISEVTVNEQNPEALGFYEHMGFEAYKRTETDTEGIHIHCCICIDKIRG